MSITILSRLEGNTLLIRGEGVIDREVIGDKFQRLRVYLKELEKFKNISWREFPSSLENQWKVFHGLQLSIQIVIDVGNHILAAIGESQIEDYTDIIDKLGERNIISAEFAQSIRGMVGLRNILIHEYSSIDLNKVYDVLQNKLDDFYKFIEYIEDYLNKKIEKQNY